MKVAVSVPDGVFERADLLAERLGMNRSQLFTRALTHLLDEYDEDPVTAALDELADRLPGGNGDAGRRLVDSGDWEW